MHRLVPQFIQTQYAREKFAGSFQAGSLFVDVSGFTAITDALMGHGQHGAEVVAQIIRDVFDPLIESAFGQGGLVTNLAGDAFTAVFPADGSLAAASARAVAAARRIQRLMGEAARQETPYGEFTFSVKVGLSAGTVNWGILQSTSGNRSAYFFQGPAIDGCADAENRAEAGQVIATGALISQLGRLVSCEAVGEHFRITSVKGKLPEAQPYPVDPVVPDIAVRFFPPEALRTDLRGEFRQVTSVFLRLPTLRTAGELERFMRTLFDLQDRYGGLLNRVDFLQNGAILPLFWGAPVAYENDVIRALDFVHALRGVSALPFNVGISYGIAHSGVSGGSLAGEYTCHGRGVTLAARMMQASPPGEIWLDERVADRASHRYRIAVKGKQPFKGFGRDQQVCLLLEWKKASDSYFQGQMVGRRAEIRRLEEFAQPLWSGRSPGALVVWGEPGMGKSRLVYDFLERLGAASGPPFSVFTCQTDEIVRESLNPFRYWLSRYFAQAEVGAAANPASFNRNLDALIETCPEADLAQELDRTRSFLGALVNLEWPGSLYGQLDAQGRYENSLAGLLALLKAESLHQPAFLLLEDVHWIDGDSAIFLRQLVHALKQEQRFPLAILATARREGHAAGLGDNVDHQEISLNRLSPDETAALASSLLGAPLAPGLFNELETRAEGNPFFAEQMLRYLQEERLLQLEDGAWMLKAHEEMALPTDVNTLLVARLDRLTLEVKEVVHTASVLGREFDIKLLALMLGDDANVSKKVEEAERLGIWTALSEGRYFFKHTLLRDAAYQMQLRARRQALHRRAAEGLETLYQADLSPYHAELAYHTEQAQMVDKAARYLALAGEGAAGAYHNGLAVDYFSRAMRLVPDDDLERRYQLLGARESLYHVLANREEQLQDQERMARVAERMEDTGKQVDVLLRRAWLHFYAAAYPEMTRVARQAHALARSAHDERRAGRAEYAFAWSQLQLGETEAARRSALLALDAARESGDLRDEGNVRNILGMVAIAEGDHWTARKHLEEFLKIGRQIGDRDRESTALGNLGVASIALGDFAAGQEYFQHSLALSQEMGNQQFISSDYVNLSWLAASRGEWETALQYGEAGVARKREQGSLEAEAEGLTWLGHARLGMGQPAEAMDAYRQSLQARRELGQHHLAMAALAGMAEAALAQEKLEEASEYVSEILAHLDGGGTVEGSWEPLRIYFACYQVLLRQGEARADRILETAYGMLQAHASKIPDKATRRMFLENVPWHREIVTAFQERI